MIDKLILGTVQLGLPYGINNSKGQLTSSEVYSLLNTAYQQGIRYLDTAEAYGKAQELIGDYHRVNENQVFSVITKYSFQSSPLDEKAFVERVLKNLEVLNVDALEAYLFHSFEAYKNFEYWQALEQLLAEKCLKKIGISVYTNDQALQVSADPRISVVQLPFNLLDNFSLRGDILTQLQNQKKEVHIRSVFLQGLLYKDRNNLGNLAPLKENLMQLDSLAKEVGVDIGVLALTYCLRQPVINKVLIGVETEFQLSENIRVASEAAHFDSEIFSAIDDIHVTVPHLLNPSNW